MAQSFFGGTFMFHPEDGSLVPVQERYGAVGRRGGWCGTERDGVTGLSHALPYGAWREANLRLELRKCLQQDLTVYSVLGEGTTSSFRHLLMEFHHHLPDPHRPQECHVLATHAWPGENWNTVMYDGMRATGWCGVSTAPQVTSKR